MKQREVTRGWRKLNKEELHNLYKMGETFNTNWSNDICYVLFGEICTEETDWETKALKFTRAHQRSVP
jgi:hypothetical protein